MVIRMTGAAEGQRKVSKNPDVSCGTAHQDVDPKWCSTSPMSQSQTTRRDELTVSIHQDLILQLSLNPCVITVTWVLVIFQLHLFVLLHIPGEILTHVRQTAETPPRLNMSPVTEDRDKKVDWGGAVEAAGLVFILSHVTHVTSIQLQKLFRTSVVVWGNFFLIFTSRMMKTIMIYIYSSSALRL